VAPRQQAGLELPRTDYDAGRRRCLLAGALLLAVRPTLAAEAQAPGPAAEPYIESLVPNARPVGSARLTWFGLRIYDAVLYAGNGRYHPEQPFVLELTYARDLVGQQIAERSIAEIERQGAGTPQQRAQWLATLRRLIPDVKQGDRLSGAHLGGQGLLLHNGARLGEMLDRQLTQAFFAIWLGEHSSEPAMRTRLLGVG